MPKAHGSIHSIGKKDKTKITDKKRQQQNTPSSPPCLSSYNSHRKGKAHAGALRFLPVFWLMSWFTSVSSQGPSALSLPSFRPPPRCPHSSPSSFSVLLTLWAQDFNNFWWVLTDCSNNYLWDVCSLLSQKPLHLSSNPTTICDKLHLCTPCPLSWNYFAGTPQFLFVGQRHDFSSSDAVAACSS